jgi:hypothetical protein
MTKLIGLHRFGGKDVLRTEEFDISPPTFRGSVGWSVRSP